MGASEKRKSTKSTSGHGSSSSAKQEQRKKVAAEPSASVAATSGSTSTDGSDVTLGRYDYVDEQPRPAYDPVLAQAKAEDTMQFVSELVKVQDIKEGYRKHPKQAISQNMEKIERVLRDSANIKGNQDKRDGKQSSSRTK